MNRWGRAVGLIERLSLGFRGPLCLVCGFMGVHPGRFFAGVCVGALITMPLQLLLGYLLRHNPNPYITVRGCLRV